MWIILKFFLLATEISVVVFSLLFGEHNNVLVSCQCSSRMRLSNQVQYDESRIRPTVNFVTLWVQKP